MMVCAGCGAELEDDAACPQCDQPRAAVRMSGNSAWGSLEIVRNDEAPAAVAAPAPAPVRQRTRPAAASGAASAARSRAPVPKPTVADDDDPNGVLSIGMVDLGGGGAGFGSPGLDLVSLPPPAAAPAHEEQEAQEHAVQESQQQRIEAIAGFGTRPERFYEAVPYFVRVLMRKRVVDAEVASVTTHRQRLDQQADDALYALGEALCVLQKDARLKKLQLQLRTVAETQKQIGAKEAASKKASAENSRELSRIAADVAKLEADAEPLRKREGEAQEKADKLKELIKRKEVSIRKIDDEVKQLRMSTDATAVDRIAALEAERAAHHGDVQSRHVQLLPLQDDLSAIRKEIAKRMQSISALHDEERKLTQAMGREQERQRVSAGGVRSAYKDALKSLALAAQKAELDALAPEASQAAIDAVERAKAKRKLEQLHRAAAQSYDRGAYTRGMYILVGATVAVFVVFAAMIVL
jgi:hypothetical protein